MALKLNGSGVPGSAAWTDDSIGRSEAPLETVPLSENRNRGAAQDFHCGGNVRPTGTRVGGARRVLNNATLVYNFESTTWQGVYSSDRMELQRHRCTVLFFAIRHGKRGYEPI